MKTFSRRPGCRLAEAALACLVWAAASAQSLPSTPAAQPWPESTPAEQGVDGAALEQMRGELAAKWPDLRSVIVVRHGKLVFEHYLKGTGPDDLQLVNSVTKSVVSALVGMAIEQKLIQGLDQKISDFIPEALAPGVDPQVRDVTVRHLLSFTAGFEWKEADRDACLGSRAAACARFSEQGDALGFALRRPIAFAPGTHFAYDSESSHLLSVILSRATKMSAAGYAVKQLGVPLGVTKYRWWADAQGYNRGGYGLWLTARDLAKFGQLYLNRGTWNGAQVVPAAWVDESTSRKTDGGWPAMTPYGFHWWIFDGNSPLGRAYFANGYGGQLIVVAPDLDAVIVTTSEPRPAKPQSAFPMIFGAIVPAIRR